MNVDFMKKYIIDKIENADVNTLKGIYYIIIGYLS